MHWRLLHKNHSGTALGEAAPSNCNWHTILNTPGTINYDLDFSHPLATVANTEPYVTDWELQLEEVAIMAGEHTNVSIPDEESNVLQIAGQTWEHYLERRVYPFDPTTPTIFARTATDLFTIVEDILDDVLAESNSLVFTYNNGLMGTTYNYRIDPGDMQSIYHQIAQLGQHNPGFDYYSTPGKEIKLATPRRGSTLTYTLSLHKNIYNVQFSNNGIRATRFYGFGAGTSTRLAKRDEDTVASGKYRLSEDSEDFGDVIDTAQLEHITERGLIQRKIPILEFTCKIAPDKVEEFLQTVELGDVVPVEADLGYTVIDDEYRVVSMDGTFTNEDDLELTIGFDDGTASL